MKPEQPEPTYAALVRQAQQLRCIHLRTKESYMALPEAHERPFPAEGTIWWCEQTTEALGPDGDHADDELCRRGCGRTCFEGRPRLGRDGS